MTIDICFFVVILSAGLCGLISAIPSFLQGDTMNSKMLLNSIFKICFCRNGNSFEVSMTERQHCFKCRFFHFCALESCSKNSGNGGRILNFEFFIDLVNCYNEIYLV